MDNSKFCNGRKNFNKEGCEGDVEIFDYNYNETKTKKEVKNV